MCAPDSASLMFCRVLGLQRGEVSRRESLTWTGNYYIASRFLLELVVSDVEVILHQKWFVN